MLFLRISRDYFAFGLVRIHCGSLVGALSLDVTGLLALVASSLGRGLGGAVAGEVTDFTAVVALLALGAVTWTLLDRSAERGALKTYETCVRSHRKSSRSVLRLHGHHRSHHRIHLVRHRILRRIHQPRGSYERCVRSLSTISQLVSVRLRNSRLM
jgi:hypothetical protein